MVENREDTEKTKISVVQKLLNRLFATPHDFLWAIKKIKKEK